MKTYKVYTKWIGYSEIGVEAKSPKEAEEKVLKGDYDLLDEIMTGTGLDYGFEDEEVLEVEEVDNG
jgi:hypothetical protein